MCGVALHRLSGERLATLAAILLYQVLRDRETPDASNSAAENKADAEADAAPETVAEPVG